MNEGVIVDRSALLRPSSGTCFVVGFLFSARLVLTLVAVHLLGMDPQAGAEIRLFLGLTLLGAIYFESLGGMQRSSASLLSTWSARWVLIFLAVSSTSLIWGETASRTASAAYWCGTAGDVATVVLLLRSGVVMEKGESLMRGFIWGTCCISLVAWIMPAQYDLRLGDEEYFNTNSIGNICAVSIFFIQYLARRKQNSWGYLAFFLSVTLLRSLSKATIAAFFCK